jgi:hypothetical protein
MTTPNRQPAMQRKLILMPPEMISKIDRIARSRNVSFAEVVREAVAAFNGDMAAENTALIEALAETMINTTREVVQKIGSVEKRLDETHTMLEGK